MGNLLALTTRELKSYWYSSVAYAVGAVFFLLQGWVFWFLVSVLNDPRVDPTMTFEQLYFNTMWFWFSVLVMTPLLTMRSFSEEKRTGTIELLLSAPVTEWQVVLSKFLAAWLSFCIYWGLTLVYFLIMRRFAPIQWAPVLAAYGYTALVGAMFLSVGVLTSSLTRNQVVAGFVAFMLSLLLFSLGLLSIFIKEPGALSAIRYVSMIEHARDFTKGILDTRPIVFGLSLTIACLVLTIRTLSLPRWRA